MHGIQFDQTVFAAIRIEGLQIRRGLGHGVFQAMMRLQNRAPSAPKLPHLIHVSGEVRNSSAEHAAEIRPVTLRWRPDCAEDTVYISALTTFRTLSMITDSRRGASEAVQLVFLLNLEFQSRDDVQTTTLEIPHRVAASDWLTLLEQVRHTSFHVIEVPLEGVPVRAGLSVATERFRAAIRHLELCQWDDAIAECRQVMEALTTAIGAFETIPPWPQFSDQQKTNWTFLQRCGAIRAMIRHATHEAHHGDSRFTSGQAGYIVDLTSVALKFYGQELL